jgi:FixJ family two-component response regulator
MMKQQIVIAIINDGAAVRVGLEKLLGAFGYRIEPHTSAEESVQAPITASRFLTSHTMLIS